MVDVAPVISRRHAAGAAGARGLLFTVLGEFVLPEGGTAWTSAFIDVFGRLGVEEKAIRQALMRTAADGWLESERVGRRTRWSLTGSAESLLVEGTERIFAFPGDTAGTAWDGRWLLVLARAPETERPTRHLLRTRLSWAGLGNPAPGVWLTPHVARRPQVEQALEQAGVTDAHLFVAEHDDGRVADLVAQAWPLDELERDYEEFLSRFHRADDTDPLVTVTELVHAWRRFPWTDPALPPALLPTPWRGAEAALRFANLHDALAPAAREQWRRLG